MKTFNEDATLRGAWRRVFARSPVIREVLMEGRRTIPRLTKDGSRHKVDAVQYLCQVCGQWSPAKEISVDHVVPVIDIENISGKVQDWNEFKRRLFCDKSNLQRICDACHNKKTQEERRRRQVLKDKVTLDRLEKRVGCHPYKELKKELSKYKSKSKAEETRTRASKLLEAASHALCPNNISGLKVGGPGQP